MISKTHTDRVIEQWEHGLDCRDSHRAGLLASLCADIVIVDAAPRTWVHRLAYLGLDGPWPSLAQIAGTMSCDAQR